MPVFPVQIQPPELTGHYPHMSRHDTALWERFLTAFGREFEGFAYDVALGGRRPTLPDLTDEEILGWQYSTAVKIDAVGFRGDEVWLIEVRPNASLSAIGHALGYLILAQRERLTTVPMVPTIVTDQLAPDVAFVAETLNLQLVTVPEPGP